MTGDNKTPQSKKKRLKAFLKKQKQHLSNKSDHKFRSMGMKKISNGNYTITKN